MRGLIIAALVWAAATSAQAGSVIHYTPLPAWAGTPPAATNTAPPPGAALQIIYTDSQAHLTPEADELYTAYRMKVLKPEALTIGNISASWMRDTDDLYIHTVKIHRAGRVIDVLATNKFAVIQREDELESSMLKGQLTANLQAPGLQVGDEIEFAATIRRHDSTLAGRSQGGMTLPGVGGVGAHRMRLTWPKTKPLRWQATPDLGEAKPADQGADYVLSYEVRDPKSVITTDGAPDRYNIRRLLQYSSFASWREVSNLVFPLFDAAATLAPGSPVRAEAAKIAASTKDPEQRAAAALALVQDRIRYVYVDLEGGNYRPASADETWKRRFGDCKAKTALLLALLRELDVPAEPVLVDAMGGDGANERLPSFTVFNHILVRADIGGRRYWLDGTRLGDRDLDLIPPPVFVWALPVRSGAADLEPVERVAPLLPESAIVLEIDATRGFDKPAAITAERALRGDDAFLLKTAIEQLSQEDAERGLKAYWAEDYGWVDPDKVAWRYDERQRMLLLTLSGEGDMDWEGDDENGHSLTIPAGGFYPPPEYKRPKEQDQTAPWSLAFPDYTRSTTIIRLPASAGEWQWTYKASEMDEQIGGFHYWRSTELEDDVLRLTKSRRTLKPEITAEEAKATTERSKTFDNAYSQVFQYHEVAAPQFSKKAEEVIDAAGKSVEKLVGLGAWFSSQEHYPEALRSLDKALAIEPGNADALLAKASVLRALDRDEDALRLLTKAAKSTTDQRIVFQRSALLTRTGHADEGRKLLEDHVAAKPKDLTALAMLADELRRSRDNVRAMELTNRGLQIDPEDLHFLQLRASLNSAEERWSEALPDLEHAVRLQPEEAINFRNRAQAYRALGRIDDALADLDEALRIDPLDSTTLSAKARTLRLAGRPQEAAALFDISVARFRDEPGPLNNRCWQKVLGGIDLDGAEQDCAQAVKLEPKVAGYWDSYGLVALRAGRLDDALKRYDQALALYAKEPSSLYGRGLTKLRKGDIAGGQADIAAAKALSPKIDREFTEAGITP